MTPPSTDILLGTSTGQILSLPLPPQDDIFKSVAIGSSKTVERDLQHVYTLPDAQPVTGVAYGFWPREPSGRSKNQKRAWVVITSKIRVYEIQGNVGTTSAGVKGGGWAEEVFKTFRDGAPSMSLSIAITETAESDNPTEFQELPGDPPNSDLRLYIPTTEGQNPSSLPAPSALAWLTSKSAVTSFRRQI